MQYQSNVGSDVGMDGWPGTMNPVEFEGGLYDMRRDPGEQYDMKREYPEIVKEMQQKADLMRKELGDFRMKIPGSAVRHAGQLNPGNQ